MTTPSTLSSAVTPPGTGWGDTAAACRVTSTNCPRLHSTAVREREEVLKEEEETQPRVVVPTPNSRP